MPASKKNKEKEPQETEEVVTDDDTPKFQAMEARLEKTIDARFERFEKAMEKFFAAPDEPVQRRKPAKRSAPVPENTHDTRNKALRSKYNSVPRNTCDSLIENDEDEHEIQEYESPPKPAPTQNARRPPSRPTGSRGAKKVNKDGGPQQNPSGPPTDLASGDKTDMNTWLLSQGPFTGSSSTSRPRPMSARDFYNDETIDAHVQNIIAVSWFGCLVSFLQNMSLEAMI